MPVGVSTGVLPYDFGVYRLAAPTNGLVLFKARVARRFLLSDQTVGVSDVAPTAQTIYLIKVDTVTVGTITFEAATNTGVAAFTGNQNVAPGQSLTLEAPAVADATHADIGFTICGVLQDMVLD